VRGHRKHAEHENTPTRVFSCLEGGASVMLFLQSSMSEFKEKNRMWGVPRMPMPLPLLRCLFICGSDGGYALLAKRTMKGSVACSGRGE